MKSRNTTAALALAAALTLGATACGSSSNADLKLGSASGIGIAADATKDAALTTIVSPSTTKGGTVTMEGAEAPDSLDPGNTYYAWVQNLSRLYARTLIAFKPVPGKDGLTVVPDLATSLGKASPDAKTWTYHIRPGLKYEDGEPITTKDVKYAIERSNFAPDVLSNGPTYFKSYLEGGDQYQGPYKDKSPNGIASIETPNDTTIVFHLAKPFADFDYLATFSQTAPVPQAKDDGAGYVRHIMSSGPYKFASYTDGVSADLVRNPQWVQATDPIRKALPNEITIKFKVDPNTIDNNLLTGKDTVNVAGAMQPDNQALALTPKYINNTDASYASTTSYLAINPNVAPFDNADCRKAIEYAIDKVAVRNAGGLVTGDVASTLLPPTVNGYTKFDDYPTPGNQGDAATAKAELTACGKPDGFTANLTARSDQPTEMAEATAIQASLKQIGITATLKTFPSSTYLSDYVGVPSYVHEHQLGLMMTEWGADWPTGYGFLDQIADGGAIKPSGGNNLQELNDPAINQALANAISNTDAAARTKAWGDIDKMVLDTATVVPLVYPKNLFFRPNSATNVTVTQAYFGMYNYALLSSYK